MIQNKTTLVGVVTLFVLSLAVPPLGVSAPPDNPMQFESGMNPSPGGDQNIAGKLSRPEAWTIASGEAKITAGGDLKVEVEGLVNPSTGTPLLGGTTLTVVSVKATLFCAGNNQTWETGNVFPISSGGDAKIEETDFLAAIGNPVCNGPIILVRVGDRDDGSLADPTNARWLAVTGF